MHKTKIQDLKRFTYICLSLTSIILSTEIQAMDCPDKEDRINRIRAQRKQHVADKGEEKQKLYKLTGVALFSGQDVISNTIKVATKSNISHVGIILSDADNPNKWHCFESTGSIDEVLQGKYPHARITSWDEVVATYEGSVNYRLFVFEDDQELDTNIVTRFVEENDTISYPKNPLTLVKAWLGTNERPYSKPLKTAFCSELAAEMLMDFGVLSSGIPGNWLPKHFDEIGTIPKKGLALTPKFKAK